LRSFVVDASVAARFVLKEEHHKQTETVLTDYKESKIELFAPPIIMSEVGNAIRKAYGRGLIGEEEAKDGYSNFISLGLTLIQPGPDDLREILKTAMERRVSFYDAEYLFTSIKVGAPLLTADDALFKISNEASQSCHLKEYSTP